MKKVYFIFLLLLVCSCSTNKQINIESLEKFSLGGVTAKGVDIDLSLNLNNEFSRIKLDDVIVTVYTLESEKPLFSFRIEEKILVKKGNSTVELPIKLKFEKSLLGSMIIVNNIRKKPENVRLTFQGKIKKGFLTKKINTNKMTVEQALKMFNADPSIFNELLNLSI